MGARVLLVYPEMPPTYWSLKYALPFIGKRAVFPPLGLLTVAALLPRDFEITLVDMNVRPLEDRDIARADVVFTSSMIVQKESLERVHGRCRSQGKVVVAGGPFPTASHEQISDVDHFVLNEAELTLPPFLADFREGKAKRIYADPGRPDVALTPVPRFDLIRMKDYATMAIQFSRGCPHNCEFCDIVELFGRRPRTKSPSQFLAELMAVYDHGWRGSLFVVDDNFIGNRKAVKELLPLVAAWQKEKHYPFRLFTEATLSLAEDEELMEMMVRAGFNMVFLGIETPDASTLASVGKSHNLRSDMLQSVRRIQDRGMEVSAGFIVGFDGDTEDIFDRQVRFIQEADIPVAMVGLLTALPNTRLSRRLVAEGRLREDSGGNNTHDMRLNFEPKMDEQKLVAGYQGVLEQIYEPGSYFERCLGLLRRIKGHAASSRPVRLTEIRAFVFSLVRQTFSSYGLDYWRFVVKGFFVRPTLLSETITMAVKGHHFFKITRRVLELETFKSSLEKILLSFQERVETLPHDEKRERLAELRAYRDRLVAQAQATRRRIHKDFRAHAEDALARFGDSLDNVVARLGSPSSSSQGSAGALRRR